MNQSTKWLVTGATGFFGSNFAVADVELIALTRSGEVPQGYSDSVTANLESSEELRAAVRDVSPDFIVHAAALASHEECERSPERAFSINEDVTRALAQESESVGAKFIYISTDAVFDGTKGNYSETDETNPFSVYGKSKLRGEIAALEVTNPLIIRTNFFGWSPSGTRSILEFFVNNLDQGNTIPGFTDFTVTSTYVRKLVQVIGHLRDQVGIWHVASTDALTKYGFGVQVAEVFGLDPTLITPTTSSTEVSRSRDISLSTEKVRKFLSAGGLEPLESQRAGIIRAHDDRGSTL